MYINWTYVDFLISLLYWMFFDCIVSQLHLIVLSSIGLLRIRFGNGGWGWYITGVILSGIIMLSDIISALDGHSPLQIMNFLSAALFFPLFFFLTKRAIRKREERRAGQGGTPDGKA